MIGILELLRQFIYLTKSIISQYSTKKNKILGNKDKDGIRK